MSLWHLTSLEVEDGTRYNVWGWFKVFYTGESVNGQKFLRCVGIVLL